MLKTIEKTKKSAESEIDTEMAKMKRLPRGSFKGETDLCTFKNLFLVPKARLLG